MSNEREDLKIQFVIPEAQVPQFRELCGLTGLKPTGLLRFGLEAAHFMAQEFAKGSDIVAQRPDGTQAEVLLPLRFQALKNRAKSEDPQE